MSPRMSCGLRRHRKDCTSLGRAPRPGRTRAARGTAVLCVRCTGSGYHFLPFGPLKSSAVSRAGSACPGAGGGRRAEAELQAAAGVRGTGREANLRSRCRKDTAGQDNFKSTLWLLARLGSAYLISHKSQDFQVNKLI